MKEGVVENDFENPIVIGDLNVRIGELQVNMDEILIREIVGGREIRNSKDKVVNKSGRQFIEFCENNGFVILNGMTNSDDIGKFTYISSTGESVNDICAISRDILKYVLDFEVADKTWSDHMPIILTIQLPISAARPKESLLPKLVWDNSQVELYNKRLMNVLRCKKETKKDLELTDLTEVIWTSALRKPAEEVLVKKSKWFNWKCQTARKLSLQLLRRFNKTQDGMDREKYIQAQMKYKEQCKVSKKEYYEYLEWKINEVKDSAEWWKLVQELRGRDRTSGTDVSAEMFGQYFKELLNPHNSGLFIHYAAILITDDSLDQPISTDEVLRMLQKTKPGKAPGLDRISYDFFRNADMQFLDELAKVYTRLYNNGQVDKSFETSIIFPLFKKGDKNLASNYRGISFMNCIAKIMMGILNERLSNWAENNDKITEYQAGFRKKHSTADNIYNLTSIIHIKYSEKKKVYAFFVDFKAAFDTVPRQLLIYKLHRLGVSTKMVNFIESIYRNTNSTVWTGESMSEKFNISSGVKQGCLMSPLLFSLYLNDLHECLEGGLYVKDLNIRLLLYADDIVILSDDVDVLQKMIYKLESYCETWNMQVNLSKSAIMVFRQGGKLASSEKWTFKGDLIPIKSEYSYLGVILTPKLSFKKHVDNRNSLAKNSINAAWRVFLAKSNIKLSTKWRLFLAVTRAIQSYAAQVWGFSMFDEVDKIQLYFLKRILRLPSNTPTYCILLETGIPSCHLYTLQLHLDYIHKTLFEYDESRLPHKLSKIIVERQIFWIEALRELGIKLDVRFKCDISNRREWTENNDMLLKKLNLTNKQVLFERAFGSSRIYKDLDHNIGMSYLNDNMIGYKVMLIFKARCDLLYLGGRKNQNCTLCNLNELESISHFLGKCPILKRIRYVYFGKYSLNQEEIIDTLNGTGCYGWDNLFRFINDALRYINLIVKGDIVMNVPMNALHAINVSTVKELYEITRPSTMGCVRISATHAKQHFHVKMRFYNT